MRENMFFFKKKFDIMRINNFNKFKIMKREKDFGTHNLKINYFLIFIIVEKLNLF